MLIGGKLRLLALKRRSKPFCLVSQLLSVNLAWDGDGAADLAYSWRVSLLSDAPKSARARLPSLSGTGEEYYSSNRAYS